MPTNAIVFGPASTSACKVTPSFYLVQNKAIVRCMKKKKSFTSLYMILHLTLLLKAFSPTAENPFQQGPCQKWKHWIKQSLAKWFLHYHIELSCYPAACGSKQLTWNYSNLLTRLSGTEGISGTLSFSPEQTQIAIAKSSCAGSMTFHDPDGMKYLL